MNDYKLPIISLRVRSDSYPLYTRIYPTGAGVAETRLTLASATDPAPTGYTLSLTGNYLERDSAVALYGRIDQPVEFPYVAPLDQSITAEVIAANVLLKAAYEQLKRFSEIQFAYEISVLPTKYEIWPGQTLRLVYDEWVDAYHSVHIDGILWILSKQHQFTASGGRVINLTVATIDRPPLTDNELLVTMLRNTEMSRRYSNPRP